MEFTEFSPKEVQVNNTRSNISYLLSRLYRHLCSQGQEQHLQYEKYQLDFSNSVLSLKGCADTVQVNGSVMLGNGISSYGHVPYEWLRKLVEAQAS